MQKNDYKKYLYAFGITCIIFFTAIYAANFLSNKRLQELHSIQDQIATDLLSSEVESNLLQEFSCKDISQTTLSEELGSLGEKLSSEENARGADDPEVVSLKQNYSLLQIKDYLLMNNINDKCGAKNIMILYFYSKKCDDCERQGLVLTKLHEDYPNVRIYSFDYDIGVSAVKTLISINEILPKQPALVIGNDNYYGFRSEDDIKKIIPSLKTPQKQATTTSAK
jgi:thiol-disulfide isomerase/thioredoxin